jgi:hypothetical protein
MEQQKLKDAIRIISRAAKGVKLTTLNFSNELSSLISLENYTEK